MGHRNIILNSGRLGKYLPEIDPLNLEPNKLAWYSLSYCGNHSIELDLISATPLTVGIDRISSKT